MIIFETKNITKKFPGVVALDSVDFSLEQGEIHALIGENGSGKSTLMKTILGIYHPDEGEMSFHNQLYAPKSARDALNLGICMIHQEISLVPTMTVAENIWLGREKMFSKGGILSAKKRREKTIELLEKLKIDLNPDMLVSKLSVASQQLVELVRAISYEAEIIIMDEPTSALTNKEIQLLFGIIRNLKKQGKTVIFITHKIDEIFAVSDRITVLRDGILIETLEAKKTTEEQLIARIIGRDLSDMYQKLPADIKDVALEVKHLSSGKKFQDISFSVRKGEILGISGLMGSGRTEVMRAIFGIDSFETGEIAINGQLVRFKTPKQAIQHGMGMVTEDRLHQGIMPNLSVKINMTLANLYRMLKGHFFINKQMEASQAQEFAKMLNIKTADLNQHINTLSGGNQQKALIARCLMTNPKIIIFDEPTRGIDIGAKSEIYKHINRLAQQGIAVIIVSSELAEILAMSDRILVMREGRIAGEFSAEEANQTLLISAAFGL